MSKCDIINSVNKIKWLFREYGALNVTEVFMYRMKPLNLHLLLFQPLQSLKLPVPCTSAGLV